MRHPALIAAAALLATATPAAAASVSPTFGTNYTFPDGSSGFELNVWTSDGSDTLTSDGLLLPAVLVAFNPQPDPPGTPPTSVSFTDPTRPVFSNGSTGPGYVFEMSFLNLMPGGCHASSISNPNSDGVSNFSCVGLVGSSEVTLDVALAFTGPGGVADSVAFNPQPDPPGDAFGFDMTFRGDPNVALSISVNGTPLDFGVPEPGTLGLFATALVGLTAWRRWRRRT
jgi:PEP-CTERM motif